MFMFRSRDVALCRTSGSVTVETDPRKDYAAALDAVCRAEMLCFRRTVVLPWRETIAARKF